MIQRLTSARILPTIAFMLIVGFLATNVASYLVSSRAVRAALIEQELPLTGSNVYSEVERDLVRPILVSSLMANDTFVRDWLATGEQDVPAIRRYLQRIRAEYGVFTAFLVSARSEAYYHFAAPVRPVRRDNPEDGWFYRLFDDKRDYEINVDTNAEQGRTVTVFINYRLVDSSGKLLAVTGVGLDFSTVRNIVARYRAEFNRNIYFVDGNGRIVVATAVETPVGSDIFTAEGLSQLATRIMGEERGEYSFERAGRTILLSQRLIPDLGWRVLVEQDEAQALRPLWIGFLSNLGVGLIISAFVLMVVRFALGRHQRYVDRLIFSDPLTGLGNRRLLERELKQELANRDLAVRPLSLIVIDYHRFSEVNRLYGHEFGNGLLARLARLLVEIAVEAPVISRQGGDEFALLWDGPAHKAVAFAESLLKVIREEHLTDPDDGRRMKLSVGVVEVRRHEAAFEVVLRAEQAQRQASQSGSDRVVLDA